jgi:perosamine synthetase
MERIPVAGPWITQKEIDYVTDAVTNCWYDGANKYHALFEDAFAKYIGSRFAVSLPSCTSAIHLSLAALGVGPSDEVIVPDVTWIASVAPISYVGATPVFADIEKDSWCLCPTAFERCITSKTKAVIPVDLYGNMPNLSAIIEIAKSRGIAVIEDSAEAFGSEIDGRKAGNFGDTGVFSFHGSKTMTTGEGGMLVTDRQDVFDRVMFLRDHGRTPGDVSFFNQEVAFKYKMSSMQAALGLAQVERADELVDRKRTIFDWYTEAFADIPEISLNPEQPDSKNSYWMTTAVVDSSLGLDKTKLGQELSQRGIDTRPFFHPLSALPAFQDAPEAIVAQKQNATSYDISGRGVNLPCSLAITKEQVDAVCSAFKEVVQHYSTEKVAA